MFGWIFHDLIHISSKLEQPEEYPCFMEGLGSSINAETIKEPALVLLEVFRYRLPDYTSDKSPKWNLTKLSGFIQQALRIFDLARVLPNEPE